MPSLDVLLPIFALTIFCGVARITLGSWLAPGAFFPLFWLALILISIGVKEYPLWPVAVWWMGGCLFLFYAGGILAKAFIRTNVSTQESEPRRVWLPNIKWMILVCGLLGILYASVRGTVVPVMNDKPPAWLQLALGAMYATPIFGGMAYAADSKRSLRILSILSMLPGIALAVAYTGRSPMLSAVYFWLAGFWAIRIVRQRGRIRLLTLRTVLGTVVLFVALVTAGVTIGALRHGSGDRPMMERVSNYPQILNDRDPEKEWYGFRHGVLSYPYSFSYYLRHAFDRPPSPHYGMLIFGGPMELLGFHTRAPYENFDVDRDVESNVYSCFMPPIEDFGLWGALVSFFVAGFLGGWGYLRIAQGRLLLIPVLTMFYPHVLVIGGYFFSYNSMIMAHLIVGTYLFLYRRVIFAPQKKRARPAVFAFNRT